MLCGREGNRRSGVTLAMRHRLQWFIHLRAHGQGKGDEHPTNTLDGVWSSLPYHIRAGTRTENGRLQNTSSGYPAGADGLQEKAGMATDKLDGHHQTRFEGHGHQLG